MSEQRCEDCKWAGTFTKFELRKVMYCQGLCLYPLPSWLNKLDRTVKPDDGRNCMVYEVRP